MTQDRPTRWVFHGQGYARREPNFANALFHDKKSAEEWISIIDAFGILTEYPLNQCAYDWAIDKGVFTPRREDQRQAPFIANFTSASQEHIHYGKEDRERDRIPKRPPTPTEIPMVWVFNGNGHLSFPSALFETLEAAEHWIVGVGVTGILSETPVGISVYDWALIKGYFSPTTDSHYQSSFIESFTSSQQLRYFYTNGRKISY